MESGIVSNATLDKCCSDSNCKNFTFHFSLSKFKGFTLAEVLITLAVIGVVAALTMPTLINKISKLDKTARLKKFYSMMSQAVLMSENENGNAREWNIPTDAYTQGQSVYDARIAYFNKYLAPYLKVAKIEPGLYNEENPDLSIEPKIYLADGTTLTMQIGQCVDLLVDINGDKKPNELGKDKYVFFIATNNTTRHISANKSFAAPYLSSIFNTRTKALNGCIANSYHCSALLIYDNFEFKDDYPW